MKEFMESYFAELKKSEQISEMIKCIHLFFAKDLNKKTAEMNMTGVQLQALLFLKFHSGSEVNPVDLERRMQLSRPTVTGILKRLESKDYITFCESSKDKRYKQVVLTETGDKCLSDGRRDLMFMTEKLCRGFEEKELDDVFAYLFRMLKNLKESEGELC